MTQESNTRTVVGVFDDYNTAKQTERDLVERGIPPDAINIQSNRKVGAAGYGEAVDVEKRESHEGGFSQWLHNLFGSDSNPEGGHYAEEFRRGGTILSATIAESEVATAADVMNHHGAVDINRHAESLRQTGDTGYKGDPERFSSDKIAPLRAIDVDRSSDHPRTTSVPVIEEEMEVGKRAVQRGGVRIFSHLVETPIEKQIHLREEHVHVERHAVDRPITSQEVGELRDKTIEITEMAEEAVVSKRARVKEEVVVGKESKERTETVRGSVRHTEVQVDQLDKAQLDKAQVETREMPADNVAYDYGYRAARDPRYSGRSWSDVEGDLRNDYLRDNPRSKWDEVKGNVRYGWEKVTGKR